MAELHALDPFADGPPRGPEVWWCEAVAPGLALGSRQPVEAADLAACADAGVEVARRRSGGGAVLVDPAATLWLDVVVPPGVVPDDVRASMALIGEWWLAALAPWLGTERDDVALHRGGLITTPWSELVCFAGTGPGELLVGEHKLVGLSQRRGRYGARFQGLVHARAPEVDIAGLLVGPHPAGPLPGPATLPGLGETGAAERLAARLAAQVTTV